ncbi:hypothetical protein ACLB2K_069608 [Fragaria x ananassa]
MFRRIHHPPQAMRSARQREPAHPNAHAWQLSTSSIEGDDYESDDAEEIRHFSHQHLFVAKDYHHEVKDDRLLTCQGCIRPITEDFYSCTKQEEQSCQFYLHKICARLPEKMLLPLLHQHHFTLLSRAPSIDGVYQCYMCGIFHHGFFYSCEKCALPTGENLFYLDLECSMYWETRDLTHESHDHRLLLDMEYDDVLCRGCGSKIFFCFSCKRCNFHLCIACVRLPLTARHRYDKHVLKLTYASRIEDEVVGYYCEICEGKRDPAHWFYWCKDCNFDCHPHCIIGRYPRVKLGSTYKHDDHVQHQVTLVSKWKSPIRGDKRDNILHCERCPELCQGLVFECRECNINFHRDGCCGATDSASSSRYVLRFNEEDERNQVVEGGPWFHGKTMFALAYDGRTAAAEVPIRSIPVWVEVFGLPPILTTTKETLYMTTSRRLADRKVERFVKNITKRGAVPETTAKKGKDYPVGPILLGFFIFVVIGSCKLSIFATF